MISKAKRGLFITLEGLDGSGKTTAIKYLAEQLRLRDFEVHLTREPGGTLFAEDIRNVIFSRKPEEEMCAMTELLLFAAARAQHIEKVIKPELDQGKVVISDRFSDSTYAYQGKARAYIKEVLNLENMVHNGFEPDMTLFFDITLDESIRRLSLRPEALNRLDNEGIKFKSRVAEGFKERFEKFQHRMHRIDAMQDVEGVKKQIDSWINGFMIQRRKQNERTN